MNYSKNKIWFRILTLFIIVGLFNCERIYYSAVSLFNSVVLVIWSFDFGLIYADFFEYWIGLLYLILNIVFVIFYLWRNGETKNKKGYFRNIFAELIKNRSAKTFILFLYLLVSAGFLAPFLVMQGPYEISNFSQTKFKKPLSSMQYFLINQNSIVKNIANIETSFSDKLKNNVKSYRDKLINQDEKIYFDSMTVTGSKALLYQNKTFKEFDLSNPDISKGKVRTAFYLFGTDEYGRDLLSRIIYGTRISLGIGIFALILSLFIGCVVGLISGYKGGLLDGILMRFVDIILAFPTIFLILLIIGLYGNSITLIILFLGITTWMDIARLVRAQVISLKEENFILAARAAGFSNYRIIFHHILPNVLTPILVNAAFRIGNIIIAESALSFIGVGVQPPIASWGSIINDGKDSISIAWWITAFPGILITITVISFNFIGDKLREIISK